MVELTALRAQLSHLKEERKVLQQQLSLQHKQHYDALVRRLFTTCLQLKVRRTFTPKHRCICTVYLCETYHANQTDLTESFKGIHGKPV